MKASVYCCWVSLGGVGSFFAQRTLACADPLKGSEYWKKRETIKHLTIFATFSRSLDENRLIVDRFVMEIGHPLAHSWNDEEGLYPEAGYLNKA